MKALIFAAAIFATVTLLHAEIYVGPWTPIFKGVDHAVGTNFPSTTVTNNGVVFTDSTLQVAHCVRVDLADPDVQLFTTPRAAGYVAESRETLSLTVPNFMRNSGVQVASDCNFYRPGDPTAEGLACEVYGLLISTGVVVSVADLQNRYATLLFTTNKAPIFNLNNQPPGTNTSGIYTAVTGFYPLLTNGVNQFLLYYSAMTTQYADPSIHGVQPRTAFGISEDKRYLFMMTIDGRQPAYSGGALDAETAMWMLLFGAWDAINMDGGGSTALYMADCAGNPVGLNYSSFLAQTGGQRERYIGSHFGVYAKPLGGFIYNVGTILGDVSATITWSTLSEATSQVDYGLTTNYGMSVNDPTPVTNHSVTLTGLAPGTRYYYRVSSSDGVTEYTLTCGSGSASFTTTNNVIPGISYRLTNDWKYYYLSLDGINWQAPGYDDAGWTNHGAGTLWADSIGPNGSVPLQNTRMPINSSSTYPYITYYFRTHFNFTNGVNGVTLTFSNYIDDGAVFYVNGAFINALRMPAPPWLNNTLANGNFCSPADAICPYVFSIPGTNLNLGDNVVAVEVHNFQPNSHDVTFGQALLYTAPPPPPPLPPFITNIVAAPGETAATIAWTTLSNSTSQVQYGLTALLGSSTTLDSTLVTNHSVTLTGLQPLTKYYFQVVSTLGATQYTATGIFSTVPFYVSLVPLTTGWAYHTNNLDGVNWAATNYDETLFFAGGPALLYLENNAAVGPRNTPLPAPFPTYYFRTHFFFDTNLAGLSLLFTNYIDDGAIFYLNGVEIQRVRMPPAPQAVMYADFATGCPHPVDCDAVTNAPDIFRISGDLLANLIRGGDNLLAAEVHQQSSGAPDVVFGSAVGFVRALASETKLRITHAGDAFNISWDGAGFTLQKSTVLAETNSWSDVPGASPYSVTNPPTSTFYRLR